MKYTKEYVYPDCIRFYVDGDLVATANTRWMSDLISEVLYNLKDEKEYGQKLRWHYGMNKP